MMDNMQVLSENHKKLMLLDIKAKRTDNGVTIEARSDIFAMFFSKYNKTWTGQYYIYDISGIDFEYFGYMLRDTNELFNGSYPNMSYLYRCDIDKGIKRTFSGVFTNGMVQKYVREARTITREFFDEHIKNEIHKNQTVVVVKNE